MSRLIDRISAVSELAIESGSLVSLPTSTIKVSDSGIPFIIHISELQQSKAKAKQIQQATAANPFLPPDPELLIGRVLPRHVSVLNKFNVLRHHLLIVTDTFEAQEKMLTFEDFEALGHCMAELDGLAFYNGGTVAGASQAHKHLQLVPLPLAPDTLPTPLDAIVPQPTSDSIAECGTLDALPFPHVFIQLDGSVITPRRAHALKHLYDMACTAVDVADEQQPYNLLLTSRWMLVVPRSREHWRRISINALGFAGSLLIRNRQELEALRADGPLTILRSVVEP